MKRDSFQMSDVELVTFIKDEKIPESIRNDVYNKYVNGEDTIIPELKHDRDFSTVLEIIKRNKYLEDKVKDLTLENEKMRRYL